MLRTALTLYLAVATPFGPALCCCFLCPLAAAAATPRDSGRAERQGPSSAPGGGCPHCRKVAAPATDPVDAPAREPSRPQQPECPCRQHDSSPALLPSAQTIDWAFASFLTQAGPWAVTSPPSWAVIPSADFLRYLSSLPPSLTAQDLLRAPHVLRC